MTDKDSELLQAICRKDRLSFELLYKGHYKKLYLLAFQYLRHQEMAEEIVNDVFLKMWNDSAQLHIKQSLGSYLSRCVINGALNLLKKEKRKEVNQAKFLIGFDELSADEDAAQLLEDKLVRLEKALETLPAQCRKVLMMSKFKKCKQQEIADTLNISIKTVKSHLTNAYEKLRAGLAKEHMLFFFIFPLLAYEVRLMPLSGVL